MAFANKDLQVGDLLLSDIGEVYLYIGFYEGVPHSIYSRPEYGYLYVFCDSWSCFKNSSLNGSIVTESARQVDACGGELSTKACQMIVNKNLSRTRHGIDGNGRYSKSYSKFSRRVGHVDIPDHETLLKYAFGLNRLGDKKPRGYKGYAWGF